MAALFLCDCAPISSMASADSGLLKRLTYLILFSISECYSELTQRSTPASARLLQLGRGRWVVKANDHGCRGKIHKIS
jgi:hypothetical protein